MKLMSYIINNTMIDSHKKGLLNVKSAGVRVKWLDRRKYYL